MTLKEIIAGIFLFFGLFLACGETDDLGNQIVLYASAILFLAIGGYLYNLMLKQERDAHKN